MWTTLLDGRKVTCSWENMKSYFDSYKDNETWVEYYRDNADDLLRDMENPAFDNEMKGALVDSALPETDFRKLIQHMSVNEYKYNDKINRFKNEKYKIKVIIEERFFPFDTQHWTDLDNTAPELRVLFAATNKEEFVASLAEISLYPAEINELLKNDCFDDMEKGKILEKMEVLSEETALILCDSTIPVGIRYLSEAVSYLNDEQNCRLITNRIDSLNDFELSRIFGKMQNEYSQLAQRTHHEFNLSYSEENQKLLEKLKRRGYIEDYQKIEKDKQSLLLGYVKEKPMEE